MCTCSNGSRLWRGARGVNKTTAKASPPRMHAERIGGADADGVLVRRAALGYQRGIRSRASQPLIFEECMGSPLVIVEIFELSAGAVGVNTTAHIVSRQGGKACDRGRR